MLRPNGECLLAGQHGEKACEKHISHNKNIVLAIGFPDMRNHRQIPKLRPLEALREEARKEMASKDANSFWRKGASSCQGGPCASVV